MDVHRLSTTLRPDPGRVLIRPFWPAARPSSRDPQAAPYGRRVIKRILSLTDDEVARQCRAIWSDFASRHSALEHFFLERFSEVEQWLPRNASLSKSRRLLIGAYFTQEYALEAAALCNPSVVPCPDQSGLAPGALRFVLSLRAVGEGHVSSMCFRCGVLSPRFVLKMSGPARWAVEPQLNVDQTFLRSRFEKKALEIRIDPRFLSAVMAGLPEHFTTTELTLAARNVCAEGDNPAWDAHADSLRFLAKSNFSVQFDPAARYSERAIFPISPSQTKGIEDARFVRFTDDDGTATYYATYTAYDGRTIYPQLVETKDFLHFHFSTLQGAAVQNKGMALFPRRIRGRFAMLSRQDNENLRLMFSSEPDRWDSSELVARPAQAWEFIKIGNCGSPIEIEEGWLVITHGVGAMRKYCLGALLLDKENPKRVIGRLVEPLIRPSEESKGSDILTCAGRNLGARENP